MRVAPEQRLDIDSVTRPVWSMLIVALGVVQIVTTHRIQDIGSVLTFRCRSESAEKHRLRPSAWIRVRWIGGQSKQPSRPQEPAVNRMLNRVADGFHRQGSQM